MQKYMFFWNSLAFSMIQRMLAIWSLVPLPFLKPAWTSGSSRSTVLLKPGLENFEHYFTSVWDECSCVVVWAFFGIACLWDWVSCRQHIYGSWFCIHLTSLCLLVAAFNPFTFKVIIDIYVPIPIFLIVWGWSCRFFLILFYFLTIYAPLIFVINMVWWYWILLTSTCLKNFYFSFNFEWDPCWV